MSQYSVLSHFTMALELPMMEYINDLSYWKNEPMFDFMEYLNVLNYLAFIDIIDYLLIFYNFN